MPGLGETVAKLGRLKRKLAAQADAGAPEGRMQEVRGFGFNPGALRMLTYAPDGLAPGAPLVVVLHGCTQRAEAHAAAAGWLTLADRLGFAVLAPEQSTANNMNRCFNWFEPEDTRRGGGEAASIQSMTSHCIKQYALDPERVFVTGLSAGGAMAAVMLAAYPEVFAAGAVIAGVPYGAAHNVQEALSVMHRPQEISSVRLGGLVTAGLPLGAALPRVAVWHGHQDGTVNHRNGADSARQWAAAHGLPPAPDRVETLQGRVRSTWRSPTGAAAIEYNLVRGLGHGTPLATSGPEGLGSSAPFMLEAGVSSTMEIARFWGLAPPAAAVTVEGQDSPAEATAAPPTPGLAHSVLAAIGPHVPADVHATIARALKSAGLT